MLGLYLSEHEQKLHLRDLLTSGPTAIEDILKKSSLSFTVGHNPDALSNSTSISSLLLTLTGQDESQCVPCINHLQTDVLSV